MRIYALYERSLTILSAMLFVGLGGFAVGVVSARSLVVSFLSKNWNSLTDLWLILGLMWSGHSLVEQKMRHLILIRWLWISTRTIGMDAFRWSIEPREILFSLSLSSFIIFSLTLISFINLRGRRTSSFFSTQKINSCWFVSSSSFSNLIQDSQLHGHAC